MQQTRFDESSTPRRFMLEVTPEQGTPQLRPSDLQHALRVLRMAAGDHLIGHDGCGKAWPLKVLSVEKRRLDLEVSGPPESAPAAGQPGAALPWIEMHVPLPKGQRAELLFDSLTQLGLARLVPLVTERTPPHAREVGEGRRERLARAGMEALKQCGRLWLPEVGEPGSLVEVLASKAARYVLSPRGEASLGTALEGHERGSPIWLIAGPEGGLTTAEEVSLVESGAQLVGLSPHTLRIETAAIAALAVSVI